MTDKEKKIVVLGDGGMAVRCVEHIAKYEGTSVPLFVYHDGLSTWTSALQSRAESLGITGMLATNVNEPMVLKAVRAVSPDMILSVNNFDIIKSDLLDIPKDGIINFHNGPLPDYRGVNIPSWVIINGETEHGVCWHYVDSGIDTGNVVARSTFRVNDGETAITLIFKCIEQGMTLFDGLLERYVNDTLEGVPTTGEGRYFSRKMIPNEGFLDFSWGYDRLSAFVRGLTFRPFENDFVFPKIRAGGAILVVSEISRVDDIDARTERAIGEVIDVDNSSLIVQASDAVVRLSGLMSEELEELGEAKMAQNSFTAVGEILGGDVD